MPLFEVRPVEGQSRLIKADRRSQVESYVLQDFVIERVEAERAAELAGGGVKVEAVE